MKADLIKYSLLEHHIEVEATLIYDQVVINLGHQVITPMEGAPMAIYG